MDEGVIIAPIVVAILFIGLPWLVFHYITQWKKNGSLTVEDERMLDELHDLARRLSDRMETVERLVAADNPGFRPGQGRTDESYAALADERRIEREDELLGARDGDPRARFQRR